MYLLSLLPLVTIFQVNHKVEITSSSNQFCLPIFLSSFWLISLAPLVHPKPFEETSESQKSIFTTSSSHVEDSFIINLISQEKFSECSVLLLRDRFDNDQSIDRILQHVSSFSIPHMKPAYSIKYVFPEISELEDIESKLKHLGLKFSSEESDYVNLTNALPVRFPVSISNNRRFSKPCLINILLVNDLRSPYMKQLFNMLTPVYIPLTKKDEDFYIFKTLPKHHKKLLLMPELPHRIKFKIAVGSTHTTTASSSKNKKIGATTQVNLFVHTICFFCEPGGKPRMVRLPITKENLPEANTNYFPDFVWDLNGKLLHVSLPYIRAKIEADAPWEGTSNARRGNWKMLFEKFLTVKFNFTYNMFVSTGIDGEKGGGGTGLLLPNKSWIGVTGDLISGKADLGIVIANTPKRIHYIDFTNSFYDIGCLTFVTAQPTRIYSLAALLWPFDLGMWIGIGMSTLLSIIFFFFAFKIMEIWRFGTGEKWSLSVQIQFLLSTFLEQDSPVLPDSPSLRSFIALWFLFTMVLTNVYRSKMVTFLAFPVLGELPKTFKELAFSDYKVGFMKHGDSAYNTLAASADPVYVKLVAEMEIFAGVGLECLEKVIKYKYGCIAYDFAMVHLRERNLSESDTRKLVFAPARTYNIWLGLGTEGKSIYRLNFSKMLSYTRQFHLADIWDKMDMYYNVRLLKRKWWQDTGQNVEIEPIDVGSDNLTLKHIAGAFYILIVALIISTGFFIQEILSSYKGNLWSNCLHSWMVVKNTMSSIIDKPTIVIDMKVGK